MTEVAVDSAVSTEQPGGAAPSESISEMGMGFIEADSDQSDSGETSAEQPAAGDGSVDAAATTTNNQEPLSQPTAASSSDDEAGALRQADYTRKTQEVAEERRQVAAERAQMAEERRLYAESQARANEPVRQDPVQALAAQLGPDEARGLQVVDQLVQERAQEIADRRVAEALEPYKPHLDQLGSAMGVVSQVAQQQTAQDRQQANAQIEAAEAIFGKVDSWDARHRAMVGALARLENPDTGQRFTVAEAMSQATGRRIAEQQDAVGQQRQARNSAKRSTAGVAGSPSLTESGGVISRAQALSEIRETM
jgi:hypothetical protein